MDSQETGGIADIYIMKDSGECLLHQSYDEKSQLDADGTLISSLLSTVEAFSSNVDTGGAKLLETTNFKFVYHKEDQLIYVARTQKNVNPEYISKGLAKVSTAAKELISDKWDGNVDQFQHIKPILEQQFSKKELNKFYEITGRPSKTLEGIEAKIYSYLRFKGRARLSQIANMMKIPTNEAIEVTSKLVRGQYLEACS